MNKETNKLYLLIIALMIVIAVLILRKEEKIQANADENPVIANIMNRKSVRSYLTKSVSPQILETLVKAGMAAPTAGNMQPWEFIIIDDKEFLKEYSNINTFASMAKNAPAAIVVLANLDVYRSKPVMEGYWPQDTSAATENILLAAESLGLGAVWTGIYSENREFAKERITKTKKWLNLPENVMPLGLIVLGYPEGNTKPKDKWKPEKIHWNVYAEN